MHDANALGDVFFSKLPVAYSDAICILRAHGIQFGGLDTHLRSVPDMIQFCINIESTRIPHQAIAATLPATNKLYSVEPAPLIAASNAVASKNGKRNASCKIHGMAGHTDAECRSQEGATPATTLSPSPPALSTQVATVPVKQERDVSMVTCHKCNKKGHYAHKCPEKSKSSAKRATTFSEPVDAEEEVGYAAINEIWNDLQNSSVARTVSSGPNSLTMHLLIDDVSRTMGLLDTGCDISYMTPAYTTELGLEILPINTVVRTAVAGVTTTTIGRTIPVSVRYMDCQANIAFTILNIDAFNVIIGLADLPNLGWFGPKLLLDFSTPAAINHVVLPTVTANVHPADLTSTVKLESTLRTNPRFLRAPSTSLSKLDRKTFPSLSTWGVSQEPQRSRRKIRPQFPRLLQQGTQRTDPHGRHQPPEQPEERVPCEEE